MYLLLALGAISPALGSADLVVGDGVDLYGTLWFFWWIADSLEHLRDPSWTDLFFYPYGKDIFGHTGNNFVDAAIAAPLQWLVGNPGYYKFWVAVVLLGNALSFRLLARSELSSRWAAFAATALWTANPYTLFEITCGRPTQGFLWFLPLAVWGVLHADRSRWAAVLAGVATALVGYTYWFYGYFLAFAFLWLVGAGLVRRWRDPAGDPGAYLRGLLLAGAVTLSLVAPAAWAMASGGHLEVTAAGEGGLLALPVTLDNGVSSSLHGYTLDEPHGARFLHHPAWALGALAWLALGRGRRRWLGVAAVGLLLATGPVWEGPGGDVPMLHYLVLHNALPFFHRLWFPYRALVLVFLALSLGLGFTLQRAEGWARERGLRRAWLVAPVLGGALLLGTLASERQDFTWPLVVRDVQVPEVYGWMAQHPGAIVELPRGITHVSIVHQTDHRLPLMEGMGANARFFWPDGVEQRNRNPFLRALIRVVRHPHRPVDEDTSPEVLVKQGFSWVVLHRELLDSEQNRSSQVLPAELREELHRVVVPRVSELLGPPVAVDGPLVVWSLVPVPEAPEALRPTETNLAERSWERPEPAPYEARLYELGRIQ